MVFVLDYFSDVDDFLLFQVLEESFQIREHFVGVLTCSGDFLVRIGCAYHFGQLVDHGVPSVDQDSFCGVEIRNIRL